ncbi:MAG: oxidoreductase [Candidatus Jordarchaeum sp.]|uniref:oxidoreductase n=1 Tax=Candidatus Jordarchaeum sp. TaxID=2823881 RepID=UPI0040494E24
MLPIFEVQSKNQPSLNNIHKFPKLFEPGFLGDLKVKNRIVMAPISTNLANVGGEVTQQLIDHYSRIARGGVGLIIIENACVHFPHGRHGTTQPRIDSDEFIPSLYNLTHAIHRMGARVGIELAHPGGAADIRFTKTQPVAPSSIPVKSEAVIPKTLTRKEIEELVDIFGKAALRAQRAGFDMVEIQAGHGLLINQFLSPLYNKRDDYFGGTLDGRIRFPKMIIERIKDYAGKSFPVSVRLGVEEFEDGGIRIEEGKLIAKKLAEAGADAIHVTVGNCLEKRLEPMPYPQGWRVYLSEEVKKEVDVPVIAVGVIREPWFAEKILEEGRADFIALGRALIADPQWPKKAFNGKEKAIRRCFSCNECVMARHYKDLPIRCSFNPMIGFDKRLVGLKEAKHKKKVMVIGAGPAGMEAARVAALRGHEVHLFDKEKQIGGTLNTAAVIPGKEKLKWIVEYYAYALPMLGVHMQLGQLVDKQKIDTINPDAVIMATGSELERPQINGIENANAFSFKDVLKGEVKIEGEKVVVIGGGLIGLETALFLVSFRNHVTVLKRYETISENMDPIYATHLLSSLQKQGVNIISNARILEIKQSHIILAQGKETNKLYFDKIVLARELKPSNKLAKEVKTGGEVYIIGDALKPRKIFDAIHEGFMIGKLV